MNICYICGRCETKHTTGKKNVPICKRCSIDFRIKLNDDSRPE
jgi:hypothetical protein